MTPTLWYTLAAALTLAGLALAAWSVFIAGRARGRPRCPGKGWGPIRHGCWYDLSGSPPDPEGVTTCPECGRRIAHHKDMLRTRRLWKPAAGGGVVVLAGAAAGAWPVVSAEEWYNAAPSTVLVFMADPDAAFYNNPVWRELVNRMSRDQLAAWQRRTALSKLAGVIEHGSEYDAALVCYILMRLRPVNDTVSAALARRLDAHQNRTEQDKVQAFREGTPGLDAPLIRAIAATGARDAIPALHHAVATEKHYGNSCDAMLALAVMNDQGSRGMLVERFLSRESPRRCCDRWILAMALVRPPAAEVEQRLAEYPLAVAVSDRTVLAALATLDVVRGREPHIATALAQRLPSDELNATWLLSWLADFDEHERAHPIIISFADSPGLDHRRAAASALMSFLPGWGRSRYKSEAEAALQRLSQDPDERIQEILAGQRWWR